MPVTDLQRGASGACAPSLWLKNASQRLVHLCLGSIWVSKLAQGGTVISNKVYQIMRVLPFRASQLHGFPLNILLLPCFAIRLMLKPARVPH